jgi:Zn-dependent protease with chaperone function
MQCTSCGRTLTGPTAGGAREIQCSNCGVVTVLIQPWQADVIAPIPPWEADGISDIQAEIVEEEAYSVVSANSSTSAKPEVEWQDDTDRKDIPALAPELVEKPDEDDERDGRTVTRQRIHNPFRFILYVLVLGYFPFLACLTLGLIGAGIGLSIWKPQVGVPLCVILFSAALHVLFVLTSLLWSTIKGDEFEIELPEHMQQGLIDLVEQVAHECDLPVPDVIRLHTETVAHIYQDERGRSILVIGGMAVAALPRESLVGIIAHELGHSRGGDTTLSRLAQRGNIVIDHLEYAYAIQPLHMLNPLTWLLRIYHRVFLLIWYADSRRAEFAADQHGIELVGRKNAAATTVLIHVLGKIPGTDLASVAKSYLQASQRLDEIFTEQVRRIKCATISTWLDAMNKELKVKTAWFDTHPQLKDRLVPTGVSPRKALLRAMDLSGESATALFKDWPAAEEFLTRKIVDIVREHYFARRQWAEDELAQWRIYGKQ